jgi:hypothetical protein
MMALGALVAIPLVIIAFVAVGAVVGALIVVGILAALVAASVAVGIVVGDAVGSIGRGGRRAPRVAYWSVR